MEIVKQNISCAVIMGGTGLKYSVSKKDFGLKDLTGFKNLSGLSFSKTEKGIINVEKQGFYALSHYFIF